MPEVGDGQVDTTRVNSSAETWNAIHSSGNFWHRKRFVPDLRSLVTCNVETKWPSKRVQGGALCGTALPWPWRDLLQRNMGGLWWISDLHWQTILNTPIADTFACWLFACFSFSFGSCWWFCLSLLEYERLLSQHDHIFRQVYEPSHSDSSVAKVRSWANRSDWQRQPCLILSQPSAIGPSVSALHPLYITFIAACSLEPAPNTMDFLVMPVMPCRLGLPVASQGITKL